MHFSITSTEVRHFYKDSALASCDWATRLDGVNGDVPDTLILDLFNPSKPTGDSEVYMSSR